MKNVLFLGLVFATVTQAAVAASDTFSPETQPPPKISWEEAGQKAQAQYQGDGLSLRQATDGSITLRCVFQKLTGQIRADGLWLGTSPAASAAVQPAAADHFRLLATALGRAGTSMQDLPAQGLVALSGQTAALQRPGLVEEYTSSLDGVRQDFVVMQPPAGNADQGPMKLQLGITGAVATVRSSGMAELTLPGSGRKLAYRRLKVTDATGRVLPARMHSPSPHTLEISVKDQGATYPVRIDPTFSDADWISMGGYSINPIYVHALAVMGDELYIGGDFDHAADIPCKNIVRWDGNSWGWLGTYPNNGVIGDDEEESSDESDVLAMVAKDNVLYVGGTFTKAGGIHARGLAKWDGTTWSAVGNGDLAYFSADPEVNALAFMGNDLYVGGKFFTAGSVTANCLARWNGTTWSAVGGGLTSATRVEALVASGNTLYVGGILTKTITTNPLVTAKNIAAWNGSTWSNLAGGSEGAVTAMVQWGTDIYIGGGSVGRWNGTALSLVGNGAPVSGCRTLVVHQDKLYAGGPGGVCQWDGSTWTSLSSETRVLSDVFSLASYAGKLMIAGSLELQDESFPYFVAQWDGTAVTSLQNGVDYPVNSMVVAGTDLYIGGHFRHAGELVIPNVAKWDGHTWSALGGGLNNEVFTLLWSGGQLYAGGGFTQADGQPANRVAVWNGTAWSALGTGTDDTVLCLAAKDGILYAGGDFDTAGGVTVNNIAKWNGSTWSALGVGTSSRVAAMAFAGSTLYAGGFFTKAGGATVNRIAKWNGSAWSAVGGGVNNKVFAIVVSGNLIYVGGEFTQAGSVNANMIACWNGTAWSALGGGLTGGVLVPSVRAISLVGTDVYVGGDFTLAGGQPASRVARWDGAAWSPIGSGIQALSFDSSQAFCIVHSIVRYGNDLIFSGYFDSVGDRSSRNLGRLTNLPLPSAPDIAVQQPEGEDIPDGGTKDVGAIQAGQDVVLSFKILNQGTLPLTGLGITLEGGAAAMYSVTQQPVAPVQPGAFTTFNLRFQPTGTGAKSTTLHIASNDPDEHPFDIILNGTATAPPPQTPPVVKTLAATNLTATTATLNGTVDAKGSSRSVFFDYGLTTAYGQTVEATPATVSGTSAVAVSAAISSLAPHTKYQFRVRAAGTLGAASGTAMTFTTLNRPPVAAGDAFTVAPGSTVTLPVLGNDTDPDSDARSLASHSTLSPANAGKLVKAGDSVSFASAAGFTGQATFTYLAKDALNATSAPATVTLTAAACQIDPTSATPASAALPYAVNVTTTGLWSATENLPWVTLSPSAGSGNGTVTVTLQPNSAKASRPGLVTIGGQIHSITQAGVQIPALHQPETILPAVVGGDFTLRVPTDNLPVTYTVVKMPPGLKIDGNTGIISGRPTKEGTYPVVISAANAAGKAPSSVGFDIIVDKLPDGLVGTWQGLVVHDSDINGDLGSRLDLTTTALGGVSGKLTTGATSQSLSGAFTVTATDKDHPSLHLELPRKAGGPLMLDLVFDATLSRGAGTLAQTSPEETTNVTLWRSRWTKSQPASLYKGLHSLVLDQTTPERDVPEGFGYASFTVNEAAGTLTIAGRTADGSTLGATAFVGPQGQTLLYQSLYAGKGSVAGILQLTAGASPADNVITGSASWFKPEVPRDMTYGTGFGPLTLAIEGSAYPAPPPGGVIMGLPDDVTDNAVLSFTLASQPVLDLAISISNPGSALVNKAQVPVQANKVTFPTLNPATGAIAGEITLPGASTAQNRKAPWQGQIIRRSLTGPVRGYGYFLMPETSAANAKKISGGLTLKANN